MKSLFDRVPDSATFLAMPNDTASRLLIDVARNNAVNGMFAAPDLLLRMVDCAMAPVYGPENTGVVAARLDTLIDGLVRSGRIRPAYTLSPNHFRLIEH